MIRSLLLRARPGRVHDGPVSFVDGNGNPPLRAGYYALSADGKNLLRPYVRLCAVTHEDGSHHYEVVRKKAPHQRPFPGKIVLPARIVDLELEAEGSAEVGLIAPAPEHAPGITCASCQGTLNEQIASGPETKRYRCLECGAEQEFAA